MSSPPPYDGNPDRRPLPTGWISQYDPNYKTWFYVNTEANPPVTTWNHPLGPVPQPRYSPPPGAPVNNNSYPAGYPAGGQGSYPTQNSYSQQPPIGGYGDSRGAEYNQPNDQRGLGGILGRLAGRSGHTGGGRPPYGDGGGYGGGGGYMASGGYPGQQQQPQVVYVEQQPQKKSGFGAGALALGVGGGLLGGALLADAFDDNNNDDCYDNGGFDDGGGDFF